MCLFGGGHGPSQETDIRTLSMDSLEWASLYPSTKRSDMTLANGDSDHGRWISTNQPYARHTYNMTVVAGRRFYMFAWYGQPDHLDRPNSRVWRTRLLVRLRRENLELQPIPRVQNALDVLRGRGSRPPLREDRHCGNGSSGESRQHLAL